MDDDDLLPTSTDDFFHTAVLFELALGLAALVVGWVIAFDVRQSLPNFDPQNLTPVISGVLWGLVFTVPMFIAMQLIKRIPLQGIKDLEKLGDEEFTQTLLKLSPFEMAVIGLCSGIGEELLFRGLLFPGIADWFVWRTETIGVTAYPSWLPVTVGLVCSSVIFGFVHPLSKTYIVISGLMGVFFGALLIWSGNLLVPITAHAAYNTVEMLFGKYQMHRQAAESEPATSTPEE